MLTVSSYCKQFILKHAEIHHVMYVAECVTKHTYTNIHNIQMYTSIQIGTIPMCEVRLALTLLKLLHNCAV